MDAPTFEHFPSQSWESWHQLIDDEYIPAGKAEASTDNPTKSHITFDADALVRQAVASRGTIDDRRALGLSH